MNYNMWGTVEDRDRALDTAIEVTGQHEIYGAWMGRVIRDWPISSENALTDDSINRKAWLGHAAMAYGFQIPENIVRQAWGMLSDEQRRLANAQAAHWIEVWEYDYLRESVHRDVGEQMLFGWGS